MNRMFWVFVGIILTVAVITVAGFASAHFSTAENAGNNAASTGLNAMYNAQGMQACPMHSSNNNTGMMGGMNCMGLSVEEMDTDNDGKCDYCGMRIEECSEMQEMLENFGSMQSMHARMHSNTGNDGFGMHCGMMSQIEGFGSNAESKTCGVNNNGMHSGNSVVQGFGMMGMHSMMR